MGGAKTPGSGSSDPSKSIGPKQDDPIQSIGPKQDDPIQSIGPKQDDPIQSIGPKQDDPIQSIGPKQDDPIQSIGPKQDDPFVASGADDAPNSGSGSRPQDPGSRVAADRAARRGLLGTRRSDPGGLRPDGGGPRPGGSSPDNPMSNASFPGGRVGLGIGVTILVVIAVVIGIAIGGRSSESAPDSSVALTTTVADQSAQTSPPQSIPPVTQASPTPTSAQQSSNGTPALATSPVVQPTAPPMQTQPPTTLDMNADADQDGIPNGIEIQAGSNPKNPSSTPEGPNFVDQYGTSSCLDQADNDLDGKTDAQDPSCA